MAGSCRSVLSIQRELIMIKQLRASIVILEIKGNCEFISKLTVTLSDVNFKRGFFMYQPSKMPKLCLMESMSRVQE